MIVDANLRGQFFVLPATADFKPIWDWLMSGKGRLIFGGKLSDELQRSANATRLLMELKRAGRAIDVHLDAIELHAHQLAGLQICQSNDVHVLALACVSGARTLCTRDALLSDDFKDLRLVPKPKGRIYKDASHHRLLHHDPCCRYAPPSPKRK